VIREKIARQASIEQAATIMHSQTALNGAAKEGEMPCEKEKGTPPLEVSWPGFAWRISQSRPGAHLGRDLQEEKRGATRWVRRYLLLRAWGEGWGENRDLGVIKKKKSRKNQEETGKHPVKQAQGRNPLK